jgi:hypothetical protein
MGADWRTRTADKVNNRWKMPNQVMQQFEIDLTWITGGGTVNQASVLK